MNNVIHAINLDDAATDEQTLHCVGAAVVALWEELPKESRARILETLGNVNAVGLRTPSNVQDKFAKILYFNDLKPV